MSGRPGNVMDTWTVKFDVLRDQLTADGRPPASRPGKQDSVNAADSNQARRANRR